jgi:hypothetical protein
VSQKDLVSRYREQTGSYYNLTVTLTEEGEIVFNEGYYYPARGDDEGREYDYYLTIEAAHFEAFVLLLMRRCQVKEEAPQISKEFLLLGLLDRLVVLELQRMRQALLQVDTLCTGEGPASACPMLDALDQQETLDEIAGREA